MKLADLHTTYVNKYVQQGEHPDRLSSDNPQKKTVPTDGIWRGERFHRPGLGLI
jgi:hypothetical protein